MVEKAKRVIPKDRIRPPIVEADEKAFATKVLASTPTDLSTPVVKMTRAVSEQMTMVSTKTSVIPQSPWRIGWSVEADAWAIGDEPSPASLVNTPLATPADMTCFIERPATPPATLIGAKAPTKIDSMAGIRFALLRKIIQTDPKI